MEHDEYYLKLEFLRNVLKDAIQRGDYCLEFDIQEKIEKLNNDFLEKI